MNRRMHVCMNVFNIRTSMRASTSLRASKPCPKQKVNASWSVKFINNYLKYVKTSIYTGTLVRMRIVI